MIMAAKRNIALTAMTWSFLNVIVVINATYTSDASAILRSIELSFPSFTFDPRIRPDTQVPITVSLTVTSLNYLDLETGLFSVTAHFSMSWYDALFQWNPGASNVDYFLLSNTDCWRPELFIQNAANDVDLFEDREQRMRVYNDGTKLWETAGVVTVPCDIDTSNKKQTCSIVLSSVYGNTEVPLVHFDDGITVITPEHPDWKIVHTSNQIGIKQDSRNQLTRSTLSFQFELEQKHSWLLIVLYLVISCLGSMVFLLPVNKGERVTFVCTILFTTTLMFMYIRVYEKYFTLGLFLMFLLVSNILQLIMTLIILRLHENELYDRPVSTGIQTFSHKVLSRLSCSCCCRRKPIPSNHEFEKPMSAIKFTMPKNTRVSPSAVARQRGQNEFDRIKSGASTRTTADIFTRTTSTSETTSSTSQLIVEEYTWLDIASMLDRIFLALSLVVFVCLTCIFLPTLLVV